MPGASDPRLRALLDAEFGSGTPTNWFIAGLLTMPAADGTGYLEPTIGTYSRVSFANTVGNWPAAATVSGRTTKGNNAVVTYPNPTADWGLIVGWGAFTTSTINSGICAYSNLLDQPITVKAGLTPVQFDIGNLVIEYARPSG